MGKGGVGDRLGGGGFGVLVGGRKLWENTRIPHTSNPPHSQGDIEGGQIECSTTKGSVSLYKTCPFFVIHE